MTLTVAILALGLAASPPAALMNGAERVMLPIPPGATLENRAFDRTLRLKVGGKVAAAAARKLQRASQLCPDASADGDDIVLRCRIGWVRASLSDTGAGPALDLAALRVPPWRPSEEGPPLVPFDTAALGLGPCPGQAPQVQGECALRAGKVVLARQRFRAAAQAGFAPLAELRLGDLALQDDDPDLAVMHWRRARAEAPWGRLAAARLCELEPACLGSDQLEAIFDAGAVARPLRADMVLRRARLRAFAGDLVGTAIQLADEVEGPAGTACRAAPFYCRHLLLAALRLPPPEGSLALSAYLDTPHRGEGPLAAELLDAAARQAELAGAPAYAASMLAAVTARVAPEALGPHLLRVAELYLEGGDRTRAEEILRFARTRLPARELASPGWLRLRAACSAPRPAPAASAPDPAQDPDLTAARAAVDAARLSQALKGARP